MPTVTFVEHDGTEHTVQGDLQRSLMQVAVDNCVPGILGDCGGSCSCATCHAYIDERWANALPTMTETEVFMLDGAQERRESSRLCCQVRLTSAMEGIVVRLPVEQG
ncbi:2Fe-2S iron-sulfur cluster-binding protein [Cupriavidus lacunae]|uniref:(2Fe-2S)-binding protein n=1 Tax=Cupriavidus lacunae TaxID=2666307 RepID=A0A370NJW5_9BURK|nr:2Fe-2S iron-sulfur cluster-binding protein [Cupriavidus lacunae]RDK05856.1 (2Fe-2S)-binding protein [Cupriavidus lacunae]